MNNEQFESFLNAAIGICRETLEKKKEEYASDKDRFHNFITAGVIKGESPEKALWGMYVKHLVSVIDIVEKIERGEQVPSNYVEKMIDSVNYNLLLWGLLEDRDQKEEEGR